MNKDDYDYELHGEFGPYSTDYAVPNLHDHGPDSRDPAYEHPCHELKKILSGGTFYYSVDFDLTNRLQDRYVVLVPFEVAGSKAFRSSEQSAFDVDNLEESFLWNSYMIDPLIKFRSRLAAHEKVILDSSRILTSAIRGLFQQSLSQLLLLRSEL